MSVNILLNLLNFLLLGTKVKIRKKRPFCMYPSMNRRIDRRVLQGGVLSAHFVLRLEWEYILDQLFQRFHQKAFWIV